LLEAIEEAGVETTLLDFPLDEAPAATDETPESPDDGAECDLKTDATEMEGTVVGGLKDTTTLGEARTLDGREAIEEPALLSEDFNCTELAADDAEGRMMKEDGPGEDLVDCTADLEDGGTDVGTDATEEIIDCEGEAKMPETFEDGADGVTDAIDAIEGA
jgi:hypothetical protein